MEVASTTRSGAGAPPPSEAAPDASAVGSVAGDGVGEAGGRLEAAARDGHLGVRALRRRVAAAEGTLAIDAGPGGGTQVRIVLPTAAGRT